MTDPILARHLHEWAQLIRAAESQQDLCDIADQIKFRAQMLGTEAARDAATGLPAVPVPPVAAAEESPAVAVALDPHRLLRDMISGEESRARPRPAYLRALRDVRARLQGEATVRVATSGE